MSSEAAKRRHERIMQARQNRLELFNQTFTRVILLDVAALGAVVAGLQHEDILKAVTADEAFVPRVLLVIAVIGFGVSLLITLLIPLWRAWWSVKKPGKLAKPTYIAQGIGALLAGISVILASLAFIASLLPPF
jgi:hypothetical protein